MPERKILSQCHGNEIRRWHDFQAGQRGLIMANFDIIAACVTLFVLGVFVYVGKRGTG
jgi:hypothetical protein